MIIKRHDKFIDLCSDVFTFLGANHACIIKILTPVRRALKFQTAF